MPSMLMILASLVAEVSVIAGDHVAVITSDDDNDNDDDIQSTTTRNHMAYQNSLTPNSGQNTD